MVSPYVKTVFSDASCMRPANTSVIQSRVEHENQATIYAAADAYRSDFGLIDIMPNQSTCACRCHGCTQLPTSSTSIRSAVGTFRDVFEDRPAKIGRRREARAALRVRARS